MTSHHPRRSWIMGAAVILITIILSSVKSNPFKGSMAGTPSLLEIATQPIIDILREIPEQDTSVILITDGYASLGQFQQMLSTVTPQGVSLFEIMIGDFTGDTNVTNTILSEILPIARKLRRASWSVVVIVASEDISFLLSYSDLSLKNRLMGSDTRLLAVTSVDRQEIDQILSSSWTFSMMNSMILNIETNGNEYRYNVFSKLPYSEMGQEQMVQLASWDKKRGLVLSSSQQLFPAKFNDFHGYPVPVTALPFPPFWDENTDPDNSSRIIYSGTDYFLLDAIAQAYNFSIYVYPTATWGEVLDRVETRDSFMASIFHAVLPERLKRFDYSFVYEYSSVDFSFSKPEVKPQWQSLYYPLSNEVWISIAVLLFLMAGSVILFDRAAGTMVKSRKLNRMDVIQELFGTLLGQNLYQNATKSQSRRVLTGFWIIFAFILGTAYRSNLIAYLTLPKFPPRPETLKELVAVAERITMPPYGKDFKAFFSQSDSKDFIKLAELMHIVPSVIEGQKQAIARRQGHLDTRRYQEVYIAQHFTRIDGTTELYVGREGVLPGKSAWPIPHDAPFTSIINRGQLAVLEGGLYEQWSRQFIEETKRQTRQRLREQKEESDSQDDPGGEQSSTSSQGSSAIRALTLTHLQGPLFILVIGLLLGLISFGLEILVVFMATK